VLSVTGETLLGFLYAMLMKAEYKGRRLVRLLIILPWAIPIVIQGMIFFLLFRPGYGLLTEPLQQLGIFSSLPLNTTFDSFVIVTVADIWKTSAFMALLILAGLESVNQDLYEVADVMGASRWQRFRYITFPLVFPVLMVAMLFRTMGALRVYGIIESTSDLSRHPTDVRLRDAVRVRGRRERTHRHRRGAVHHGVPPVHPTKQPEPGVSLT
ncbi:carbohydrate ABC transporter permease, partial [Halorubrum sp. SS7]|uniref:carbohydrate ABC transporter permease n=1 Tax=Halorubrum sp. SS7 TaxID=2518119 RepID=UPI0018EE5D73